MAIDITLDLYRSAISGFLESGVIPDTWVDSLPPSVSSYSGTFADGNVVTIRGSNFSKKNTTQSFFTNFSSDTVGQRAANFTYWTTIAGDDYLVDSTNVPPIGSRCMSVNANNVDIKTIHWEFPENQDEVFFEAWSRVNPIIFHQTNTYSLIVTYGVGDRVKFINPANSAYYNFESITTVNIGNAPLVWNGSAYVLDAANWIQLDQPQVKLFRIVDGTGEASGQGRPVGMSAILEADGALYAGAEDGGLSGASQHTGYDAMPDSTTWAKYTMYAKRSTLDVANGLTYIKVGTSYDFDKSSHPAGGHLASPSGAVPATQYTYSGTPFINNETGKTNQGLYYRRVFMTYYQRNQQHTAINIAHVYINNSPERVVIGDASTWNACDHSKSYICKTIDRDNTAIQISAITSANITGSLYAYVVNRDGVYNSTGVQVR